MERDVEQPALTQLAHRGHTGNGLRGELAVLTHDAQPSRPLRHQHAAVGQERETPGMLEPLCERYDAHRLELGSHHALGCCREREQPARGEEGEQIANGSSHHGSGKCSRTWEPLRAREFHLGAGRRL